MSRELPFPISFELPDGWTLVPPDRNVQSEAAYVAVRDADTAGPVAANIVISGMGLHNAAVDVAALAAARLANLQATHPVTVLKNDIMTAGQTRQAAQLLQIEYPVGESTTTLRQIRIVNAFGGAEDPAAVAVVSMVMTCPADVFDQAGREFGQFVASIAPAAGTSRVDRQPGPIRA